MQHYRYRFDWFLSFYACSLPLNHSANISQAGFSYHHAEPGYVMLTYWIANEPCMLPSTATHQVGVGGFVINENREVSNYVWQPILRRLRHFSTVRHVFKLKEKFQFWCIWLHFVLFSWLNNLPIHSSFHILGACCERKMPSKVLVHMEITHWSSW